MVHGPGDALNRQNLADKAGGGKQQLIVLLRSALDCLPDLFRSVVFSPSLQVSTLGRCQPGALRICNQSSLERRNALQRACHGSEVVFGGKVRFFALNTRDRWRSE